MLWSFDLFIMAFLKLLVRRLELFARINFCFFGAYLSSIDRKISVNSDSSALFKSIFNNSLFNSLWNTWLSKFLLLLYWMIFGSCFLYKTFITVMTILWNSDIPASIVRVFWKLCGRFVRKRSIYDGLSGSLKNVGPLTRLNN